jgi:phosphate transport system substrate-binding protein
MILHREIYLKIIFLFSFFFPFNLSVAAPPLRIVGSSAVFPFAATVAEHFHHKTHSSTPLIEATGTGTGIKLFCGSLTGADGVMTSRSFTENEKKKCESHGIKYIELKIGQDGLVLIQNKKENPFFLTLQDLGLALAEKIQQNGKCIANPYKSWEQVNPSLPPTPLHVLGPAPTSGTYDILTERISGVCGIPLRRDGVYVEAPSNENLIVQKVLNAKHLLGIVTFSFYEQNKSRLNALSLEGVLPSYASIQEETYPLSRPLYLYIKINDTPQSTALYAYTLEFLSKEANGEKGYLREKGLIPLEPEEQIEMQQRIQKRETAS